MILVTGATGYIGRHLVARLVAQKERPRCLVRNVKQARRLLGPQVELVSGSTTQPETLTAAVQGIETIIHAAFMTADRRQTRENRYWNTNVNGTSHLINAAQEAGVSRMIEVSGLGTRRDKPGSYMQGRFLAEHLLMDSTLDWTIVRPSVVFGDDAPFIKGLTNLIRSTPVVPLIGGGTVRFQPIYVEDVASVLLNILAQPKQTRNKIYTIGGPEYWTFTELIDALRDATGKHPAKVYAPLPLVGLGAAVMETILPRPPLTSAALTLFTFDNTTDLDSIKRDFGFDPFSLHTYLETHSV